METTYGFQRWHHRSGEGGTHIVFPDGCRDVLLIRDADGSCETHWTPLDYRPRRVELAAGRNLVGYRLRPGALLSALALTEIMHAPDEAEAILLQADSEISGLTDPIELLAQPECSVTSAARTIGVSVRTMERRFEASNLPSPDFWRLLARARRTAVRLTLPESLAHVADGCGYSDQAHMTRDLARWFGFTPARLRQNPALLRQISQPGLGNWTGEHISTR